MKGAAAVWTPKGFLAPKARQGQGQMYKARNGSDQTELKLGIWRCNK